MIYTYNFYASLFGLRYINHRVCLFYVADYVGHIKLVNGQVLSDSLVLDDAEIAASSRVMLHVQTHE